MLLRAAWPCRVIMLESFWSGQRKTAKYGWEIDIHNLGWEPRKLACLRNGTIQPTLCREKEREKNSQANALNGTVSISVSEGLGRPSWWRIHVSILPVGYCGAERWSGYAVENLVSGDRTVRSNVVWSQSRYDAPCNVGCESSRSISWFVSISQNLNIGVHFVATAKDCWTARQAKSVVDDTSVLLQELQTPVLLREAEMWCRFLRTVQLSCGMLATKVASQPLKIWELKWTVVPSHP